MGFRIQLPVFKFLVMGGVGLGMTACNNSKAGDPIVPVEADIIVSHDAFNLPVNSVNLIRANPNMDDEDSLFNLGIEDETPDINLVFHTPDQVSAPVYPQQ